VNYEPAPELMNLLGPLPPGRALDLACGAGRHARWLAAHGWDVTAVDIAIEPMDGVRCVQADLERHEFVIEPGAWDVIVCWLYWQADLLPDIAAGVRPGGMAAMAGKTSGRFATSLARFRTAFPTWTELASGEDALRAFLIVCRAGEESVD
jgi:2-polyprenyl-3-methyl-5-hydroxy-6-metoxy-1,4-benzoquinol methylase